MRRRNEYRQKLTNYKRATRVHMRTLTRVVNAMVEYSNNYESEYRYMPAHVLYKRVTQLAKEAVKFKHTLKELEKMK